VHACLSLLMKFLILCFILFVVKKGYFVVSRNAVQQTLIFSAQSSPCVVPYVLFCSLLYLMTLSRVHDMG
jgi:hypothetical protein